MNFTNKDGLGPTPRISDSPSKKLQMAALCHLGQGASTRYLLVTSRDTGRWIIPKGWPIPGLTSSETALQEAWEEAGVRSNSASITPIGRYWYDKRLTSGADRQVETLVYSVTVRDLANDFPEMLQRTRKWVTAQDAAEMVNEPDLQSIFRSPMDFSSETIV